MMSFLVILDCALGVVLLGFNGWNWFLAMTGFSTIEFWGQATRVLLLFNITKPFISQVKSMISTSKT